LFNLFLNYDAISVINDFSFPIDMFGMACSLAIISNLNSEKLGDINYHSFLNGLVWTHFLN